MNQAAAQQFQPWASSPPQIVRPATLDDLDGLVALGRAFLGEVYRGRLAENPAQMAIMARQLIENPHGLLLVAEAAESIVGMIGMLAFDHHLSGERIAAEVFWYVDPQRRGTVGVRLLQRAEQWAVMQGAQRVQMVAPSLAVGALYQRRGYQLVEYAYERTL